MSQVVRIRLPMQELQDTLVRSLGQKGSLELEMATHSSILAWEIPRTEEPGGLQSMGSLRVGHDWAQMPSSLETRRPFLWSGFPGGSVKKSACTARDPGPILGLGRSPGEVSGNSLQYSCLGNPMDRGAWWAAVHGVAKSWTWLHN